GGLSGSPRNSRLHLPVSNDRPTRLRNDRRRLFPRPQEPRTEGAQVVQVVLPERRRLPRSRQQPDARGPGFRVPAPLHAPDDPLVRAGRHFHHRGARTPQARLDGAAACRPWRISSQQKHGLTSVYNYISRRYGQMLNQKLDLLHPYPFERLAKLQAGIEPDSSHLPINLSIGEPRHPTPALLTEAMCANVAGLASYPATAGSAPLRDAIAAWIGRRYGVEVDPATEVLPVNGSREALFAFAQVVIDPAEGGHVVCPNPFYQIYEGAALLAGAAPWYLPQKPEHDYRCDWSSVPDEVWASTRLVYLCTPGNPPGVVTTLDEWRAL